MADTPRQMLQSLIDKVFIVATINFEIAVAEAAKDTETVERSKQVVKEKTREIQDLAQEIMSRMV